ncbi:MAG: peroxiredoxin [Acidimicrobiales bacterium]
MRPGDLAFPFSLPDERGITRTLGEFLEVGPVVVFFYPAAMTSGCTAESCHFRDLGAEFAALGASRVGISHDDVATQRRFAAMHGFDYPLLSDPDGAVARHYGVRRPLGPAGALATRRWTFVIARDGRVVKVIKSAFRMTAHADRALAALSMLPAA